jgi:hypothetical protein
LEDVEFMSTQGDDKGEEELTEVYMTREMAKKQLSGNDVEMESVVEWQANATGDEIFMGDQGDLPIDLYGGKEM